MTYRTLIGPADLAPQVENPSWAVVDCRFTLDDTERGRSDYQESHIPGAVYAHLDEDLSGPIVPGQTGRHPLPAVDDLAATLSNWGIDSHVQVIAYDDAGGAIAARLWWLLRWLGHDAVAVLDGGWPAWLAGGHKARGGVERRSPRAFVPNPQPPLVVTTAEVVDRRPTAGGWLFDSRSADRFRGENETIDPVAGRIPGAVCAPYQENLDAEGRFLSPQALQARFAQLLGATPVREATFYCGSGVTAAHNLLAIAHAGLGVARLYAGSWSEWITDPDRPIATGPA